MRPQFASRPNSAVFTSGEVAIRRAIARASASLAAPVTAISATSVAPSPSATICAASSLQTRRSASTNASSLAGVALDRRRSGGEQHDRVVRRALAVDRDRVEARVDGGAEEVDRLALRERVVGRDDGEHRRQVGVDHPAALRHPADGEAGAVGDRGLRVRVRGEDRVGRVGAALDRERGRGIDEPGAHAVERQRRADHAGGEDEHLLGVEVEEPGGLGGGAERVELAALAGERVRDAAVDHDRLRLRQLEVRLRDEDGRGLDAVLRPHRRSRSRAGASARSRGPSSRGGSARGRPRRRSRRRR